MTKCSMCCAVKELTAFAFKSRARAKRLGHCRACASQLGRAYYARDSAAYKCRASRRNQLAKAQNRERMRAYLMEHPCVDCGLQDLAVLEFDHRDPKGKLASVSNLAGSPVSWSRVFTEIGKCDV